MSSAGRTRTVDDLGIDAGRTTDAGPFGTRSSKPSHVAVGAPARILRDRVTASPGKRNMTS